MAKNCVIAGDYENCRFLNTPKGLTMTVSFTKQIPLDKSTVKTYEVYSEESRASAVSAVGRGLVGSFLLGPVGILAGLSAKKKGTHVVAIEFKDGKKSLLEIDDKLFNTLLKTLF